MIKNVDIPTLTSLKRLVIKIGSSSVVDSNRGGIRIEWMQSLADDIRDMYRDGKQVVVVSSGAVALGQVALGAHSGYLSLERSQAAAAIGQIQLAKAYSDVFASHGITTAQILTNLDDSRDRKRYLNCRATLQTLLENYVIPIVNENDTTATDEICYGDNDRLAAKIALMIGADALMILSNVDGLYTTNPFMNTLAERLNIVCDIDKDIIQACNDAKGTISKGGMRTKLLAARVVTKAGCLMSISSGNYMNPVSRIWENNDCTWFLPKNTPQKARKRWISSLKVVGDIIVDSGAANALHCGRSLLPAGIVSVKGNFRKGDAITLTDTNREVIGTSLVRYTSYEIEKIAGCRSCDIEKILGYPGCAVVAHHDDLVLWTKGDEVGSS